MKNLIIGIILVAACFFIGIESGPKLRSIYEDSSKQAPETSGNFSKWYKINRVNVVIFTTSTCPFCKKTRYILESNGIEYKDYVTDVTKTAEEQYLSLGEKNVPIILIGNTKLRGLNEKELIQVLNANKICGTNLCKTPAALSAKI